MLVIGWLLCCDNLLNFKTPSEAFLARLCAAGSLSLGPHLAEEEQDVFSTEKTLINTERQRAEIWKTFTLWNNIIAKCHFIRLSSHKFSHLFNE